MQIIIKFLFILIMLCFITITKPLQNNLLNS